MISTVHETTNVNPYLTSLQNLVDGKEASLDWLVIAHNDPVMLQRLSNIIDESASALLQIPQSDWDFHGQDLPRVINWAVQETGLKHLLLLGHSKAEPTEFAATWIGENSATDSHSESAGSSFNRLLDGARRVQQQASRSKSDFQSQVEHLLSLEDVREAVSLGKLKVHALFYMDQAGTFLRYDPAEQAFDPLV